MAATAYQKRRRTLGVPAGFRHEWDYKVKSYKEDSKGNFTEVQSKSRTRRTRTSTYGNFGRGTKLKWKWKGKFNTTRLPSGTYKTVYKLQKRNVGAKVK